MGNLHIFALLFRFVIPFVAPSSGQRIVEPSTLEQEFVYSLPGRPGLITEDNRMVVSINDRCFTRISETADVCCQNNVSFEYCWEDLRQTFGLSYSWERCCLGHVDHSVFYREMKIADDFDDVVRPFEFNFDPRENNEVLVFLHDRKTGGRNFEANLFVTVHRRHHLVSPIIQDAIEGDGAPGGTHFLPLWAGKSVLSRTQVIAGHYDWNVFGLLRPRQARCVVPIRNPVEKFVSYVLQRAANASYWLDDTISPEDYYLRLMEAVPHRLVYNGNDLGLYANLKRNHGMQLSRQSLYALLDYFKVDVHNSTDAYGFRELGGPHNTLLRMLSPDFGDLPTAMRRLEKCLVVKLTSHREEAQQILDAYLPWMQLDLWSNRAGSFYDGQRSKVFSSKDSWPRDAYKASNRFGKT